MIFTVQEEIESIHYNNHRIYKRNNMYYVHIRVLPYVDARSYEYKKFDTFEAAKKYIFRKTEGQNTCNLNAFQSECIKYYITNLEKLFAEKELQITSKSNFEDILFSQGCNIPLLKCKDKNKDEYKYVKILLNIEEEEWTLILVRGTSNNKTRTHEWYVESEYYNFNEVDKLTSMIKSYLKPISE